MIPWILALSLAGASPASREADARRLEQELMAPCCWSQQVSVHSSPAAQRIREDIRVRLAAGESRQQILDAYVAEYGEAILVEPPARGSNLALYIAPPIVLGVSGILLVTLVRRFSRVAAADPAAVPGAVADPGLTEMLDRELEELD